MSRYSRSAEQVLEDELINCGLYSDELIKNPRKALDAIISWNVEVALDPKVSSEAESSRVRGCPLSPLTPPYVRFRIRRFKGNAGDAGG